MITPIYRDYGYSQHSRIFYPKKYIDYFDVDYGDFKKRLIEKDCFLKNLKENEKDIIVEIRNIMYRHFQFIIER